MSPETGSGAEGGTPEAPDGPGEWGVHDLPEGESRTLRIGPLVLRSNRQEDEIRIAYARPEQGEAVGDKASLGTEPSPAEMDDDAWSRWALPRGIRKIRVAPVFPDRPLVVAPEESFHLLPDARVKIFVRVPLHARIEVQGDRKELLCEIPTVVLSDTWFGDVMEGELCYFLPSTARRTVRPEHFRNHLAVCPVLLENRSDEALKVQELVFRVAHLTLFRKGSALWADETRVRYRGTDAGSDLTTTGRPPENARDAVLVTEPRTPADRSLRARTFTRLRDLSGLGGPA